MLNVPDLFRLARQYEQAQQFHPAEEIYRQIVQLEPQQYEIWHRLGRLEMASGKLESAISSLQTVLSGQPDNVEAYCDLGALFRAQGALERAETAYRNALMLNHRNDAVLAPLAEVMTARGDFANAALVLQQRRALNPGDYPIANNLGVALRKSGALDEAADVFRQAAAMNPHDGSAYLNLVQIDPHLSSGTIARIEAILQEGELPPQNQAYLSFTLGIVYNRLKKYDQAFACYQRGNDLQRQLSGYQHQAALAFLRTFESVFDADFFRGRQVAPASTESPIFIIGMPRSGSTLVEQILATHHRVYGGDETRILDEVLAPFIDTRAFATSLAAIPDKGLRTSAQEYMQRLRTTFGDHECITNKKLDNYLYLGVIALMFPNARIIHCKRDPLDNCLSCYLNWFSTGQYFTHNLQELGEYYRACERLMAHWHRVLPLPILDVQYEELVRQQESVTRKLLAFCGLEWDPHCLAFHSNNRRVQTNSDQQVRQPLYQDAIARWQPYDHHLAPLRAALQHP